MELLNEKETLNYIGGAKIGLGVALLIAGACSFLLGVWEGISNPKACNKG